jgi:hypothetical protein
VYCKKQKSSLGPESFQDLDSADLQSVPITIGNKNFACPHMGHGKHFRAIRVSIYPSGRGPESFQDLDSADLQSVPITIGNKNFACPHMWARKAFPRYPCVYISERSGL